jgi:N-acetylglucosamine repressor
LPSSAFSTSDAVAVADRRTLTAAPIEVTALRKINTHSFVRATRATPREVNTQIVLNLVREHQPISRADLARRMDVRRGMVTSLVDVLLAEGAIYEGAAVDAPRGRRPTMLYVRTRDRFVIAVDVRFSRTYVMLADFGGNAIALETFETVFDPDALVARIVERARALLVAHDAAGRCEGVGVAVPGLVDRRTGRVLHAPQLGWRNVDIRDALADAMGLPVHLENAPAACALAQMWLGRRGVSAGDFVFLTVSDGVGTGFVVNGQMVRGHANAAGEFGHLPLDVNGPECLCGARGCLEAYTSNLATISRYLGQPLSHSRTRALLTESGLTIDDVIARARAGEARAVAALDATAHYLGIGLGGIINALNPSQIFVAGEITAAWDLLAPTIHAAIASRAFGSGAASTPIIPEPADSYPRLRGACALIAAPQFAAPQLA